MSEPCQDCKKTDDINSDDADDDFWVTSTRKWISVLQS